MTTYTLPFTGKEIEEKLKNGGGANLVEGDGISISDNKVSLNETFYNYLLEHTFTPTTIDFLTANGYFFGVPAQVVGSTFELTKISHRETNVDNIIGTLSLSREHSASLGGLKYIAKDIPKSESTAVVEVSDKITVTQAETITYTLNCTCKNAKGENDYISRDFGVKFYWPVYRFASSSATPDVTEQEYPYMMDSVKGTQTVKTDNDNKHIHFITTETISKITSSGLEVPFTSGTLSVTINGCTKTYKTYSILNCSAGENTFVLS